MQTTPTALVVDDEPVIQRFLANVLKKLNCNVVAFASDGEEAVNRYQEHKPDITLLDIHMPKMHGVKVLKQIKALNSEAFICMVSANASVNVMRKLMPLGVSYFVVKPVKPKKIALAIEKYHATQSASEESQKEEGLLTESTTKDLVLDQGSSKEMIPAGAPQCEVPHSPVKTSNSFQSSASTPEVTTPPERQKQPEKKSIADSEPTKKALIPKDAPKCDLPLTSEQSKPSVPPKNTPKNIPKKKPEERAISTSKPEKKKISRPKQVTKQNQGTAQVSAKPKPTPVSPPPKQAPADTKQSFYPSSFELERSKQLIADTSFQETSELCTYLQQELLEDDPNLDRIILKISSNPIISEVFLKLINTATELKQKVTSISQCIVLVGQNNIKKLLIVMALRNSFGDDSYFAQNLWGQAIAMAVGAEMISRWIKNVSPEEAFLAGMFQDVGVLIFSRKSSDYQELYRHTHPFSASLINEDRKFFKTPHTVVSYLLAKQWELSKQSCDAILLSHITDITQYSGLTSDSFMKLVLALKVSNHILGEVTHPDVEVGDDVERAYQLAAFDLDLSKSQLIKVKRAVTHVLEASIAKPEESETDEESSDIW